MAASGDFTERNNLSESNRAEGRFIWPETGCLPRWKNITSLIAVLLYRQRVVYQYR